MSFKSAGVLYPAVCLPKMPRSLKSAESESREPLSYATVANASGYNRGLFWLALLTALATVPLIFLGGQVTTRQAGLSVPDWPNSYGYNMWLFPPRLWTGGIFWEHTHRLKGTIVGFLAILLVIWAWKTEPRVWVRWLCYGILAAVVGQGVLGGLRVIWINLDLAIIHACTAQAFFAMVVFAVVVTSRWWHQAAFEPQLVNQPVGSSLIQLSIVTVLLIYGQLIAGAVMRHNDAGLAIPGVLVYGKLLPPATQVDLDRINQERVWQMHREEVSFFQLWTHFIHRAGAVLVTAAVLLLVGLILARYRRHGALVRPAWVLLVLLIAQVTLGVLTIYYGQRGGLKPYEITSLHVVIGALVLVETVVILTRAARLRYLIGDAGSAGDAPPVDSAPALQGI